jgi:hypothetical protein
MSECIRVAAGTLCLGVLALGVVVFDPACLLTFPHREDPDKKASLAEEIARKEQLNQQEAALRRQWQTKRRLAAEVIARRRSRAEAIELFRARDQEWPELPSALPTPKELGISADEWVGRDFLYFVQLVLADRPDEAAAVANRLEMELQKLLPNRRSVLPRRPRGVVESSSGEVRAILQRPIRSGQRANPCGESVRSLVVRVAGFLRRTSPQ